MSHSLYNIFEQIAQENNWEYIKNGHIFLCTLHKNTMSVDVFTANGTIYLGERGKDQRLYSATIAVKITDPISINKIVSFLRELHE